MRNVSFQLKHQVKAVTQSPINSVWFLQIVNWIRDSAVIWTNFWLNIWTIILNGFIFKWAYKTALSKGKWQKWRNFFFFFFLLLFFGHFVVVVFCLCLFFLFAFFLSLWCYCFCSHFGVIITGLTKYFLSFHQCTFIF